MTTYKCCYGISSRCPDYKHVIMLDYDNIPIGSVTDHIRIMQRQYSLGDFYIIKTLNGYNAICLDKLPFGLIHSMGIDVLSLVDRKYLELANKRNYFTLRFDMDKKLEKIIEFDKNKYEKSLAHKQFLEWFFNIYIEHTVMYDENTKLVFIQYPSEKNGYHNFKKLDYVTELKQGGVNGIL